MGRSSIALLYSVLSLALVCSANCSQQHMLKIASFMKGDVLTSRTSVEEQLAQVRGRTLLGSDGNSMWVLGVPVMEQASVHDELVVQKGQVLYALPSQDHHWIIRATINAVQQLMGKFDNVTAAPYPESYKLSQAVDTIASAYSQMKPPYPTTIQELPAAIQPYVRSEAGGRLLTVMLAMVPDVEPDREAELVTEVTNSSAAIVSPGCDVTLKGITGMMVMSVCMQDVSSMADMLAAYPEVTWVDIELPRKLMDLESIATVQAPQTVTLGYPSPTVNQGTSAAPSAQHFPIWQAGIDGTGQIVGVVDSGLDMDSCYVWDPNYVNYQSGPSTGTLAAGYSGGMLSNVKAFRSNQHRKVALYAFLADSVDDLESHGTHVTTSIIGSPYGVANITSHPDQATGIAPNARVAIVDVGHLETLQFSDSDLPGIYNTLKSAGAHVTCNSWGYDSAFDYISPVCELLDAQLWNNPSTMHVFAAGNNGTDASLLATNGTVSLPATCKNVMAVGAAENFIYKGLPNAAINMRQGGSQVVLPPPLFLGPTDQGFLTFQAAGNINAVTLSRADGTFALMQGFDSTLFPLAGQNVPVVLASPQDACTPLSSAIFPADGSSVAVVFVRSTACTVDVALRNVLIQQQSAAAFFYYNFPIRDPLTVNGLATLAKPTAVINTMAGSFITGYIQAGTPVTVTWAAPDPQSNPPAENVALFSGYGSQQAFNPARGLDGTLGQTYRRIKPDVTAPGYIQAGFSDGQYSGAMDQCATVTFAGTSMATPQVAGAGTLVRQYFMDGYYPRGIASQDTKFTPSGPLIKATLIAGTVAMQGVSRANGQPLQPPPSPFQGFGRVDLTQSLPVAGSSLGWNMQVIDNANLAQVGVVDEYEFTVVAGKPLIITMTYYDYKGYTAGRSSLVNDLDLSVEGPLEANDAAQTYFPNSLTAPDPANNVEKIYIADPQAGTYRVSVRATYLFIHATPQPYAVVILGGVNSTIASQYNPGRNVPIQPNMASTSDVILAPSPGITAPPAPKTGIVDPGAVPRVVQPGAASALSPSLSAVVSAAAAATLLLFALLA